MLQRPTLVLNRSWQPINVATVARALILLWNDSAKVVDPIDYQLFDWSDWSRLVPDQDEPFIQSVRQKIRVPEVITLTQFDRMPTQAVTLASIRNQQMSTFVLQHWRLTIRAAR